MLKLNGNGSYSFGNNFRKTNLKAKFINYLYEVLIFKLASDE